MEGDGGEGSGRRKSKEIEFPFQLVGRARFGTGGDSLLNNDGPRRGISKKGKVFLLGEIVGASNYLKGLDMFVLPSIYEGLSISLIEALSSGIKVIASRVGGNEEIIGESNCFELNDPNDFLRVFELIIDSRNIYENQEKFFINTMTRCYSDLYNN